MKKTLFLLSMLFSPFVIAQELSAELKALVIKCEGCHGKQGISVGNVIPNLAGQHASYMVKQLHDYHKGITRNNPNMSQVLKMIKEEDYETISLYYASLRNAQGETPQKYVKRGEALYRGGDRARQITACIACHGPRGMGNGPAKFPVLSGQKPEYTIQQLENFKSHHRKNDLNGIMRDIAGHLDEKDMKALAYYCSGLH